MNEISRAKDNLIGPIEFKKNSGSDFRMSKISEVYELYQKKLKESDAMDFDDLIFNTVLLLRSCSEVLEYYQNKFKYILVDEYQDTNYAQYVFINMIAKKNKNLCVVGDDDQSIYKFRGATIENILNFEKDYPNAKIIRLEQNYRSTQIILNAANSVIGNNYRRKDKKLWTSNGKGSKICLCTSSNEHEEAKYIADKILESVSKGGKYSDCAILYRMNSQSNVLEKILVKSGIPHRIIGGFRFYERREVRDMIAYLSVINNPFDEIRLRRIANKPKRAIGEKTISEAMNIAMELNVTLIEIMRRATEFESLKRSASKLVLFANNIDEFIDKYKNKKVSISELYNLILEKTGYISSIVAEKDDSENRVENINELLSNIIKYEEDNKEDASLGGFLEEISLFTDIDNHDDDSDSVVLMTMHSAKGLEFSTIFLPGFEEGIFPGIQSMNNESDLEEERRLAYVAITRAKKNLYILNSETRMIFGSTSRNKQSRFAKEIPAEYVDIYGSGNWKKADKKTISYYSNSKSDTTTFVAARNFGQPSVIKRICSEDFISGDKINHKTFGNGTIKSVKKMGNDNLVEIHFDRIGLKKLMANFAKLEKI